MVKRLVNYLLDGRFKDKTFIARKNSENILYHVNSISKDRLHVMEYDKGQFQYQQTEYNLIGHLMDSEWDQKAF